MTFLLSISSSAPWLSFAFIYVKDILVAIAKAASRWETKSLISCFDQEGYILWCSLLYFYVDFAERVRILLPTLNFTFFITNCHSRVYALGKKFDIIGKIKME